MEKAEIYIQFLVAIFGIAYPIIIQVISRLEDKYCSKVVIDLFEKELTHRIYFWLLIISTATTILWTLNIPPNLLKVAIIESIFNDSAKWLVMISIISLIFSFFFEMKLLLTYSVATKLADWLIKHYDRNKSRHFLHFIASSDLLMNAIRTNNNEVACKTFALLGGEFDAYRKQEIEYPPPYYELNRKLLEDLITTKSKALGQFKYRIVTASLLLREDLTNADSNNTLSNIWQNLMLMLESDNIDMFMLYWESMDYRLGNYRFQKLHGRLRTTQQVLSMDDDDNQDVDHDEENPEKLDLIDFRLSRYHIALGGLVVYLQKYEAIKRMFLYTSSEPPKYHLLPNTLKDVYELFVFFLDTWGDNFSFISFNYYFPHIEGVNQDNIIQKWICSYLAILFLRLYKLRPQYFEQDLLEIQELPQSQREKRIWLESIESFRFHVNEWIKQPEALEIIGLGNVSQNWQDKPAKEPDAVISKIKDCLTTAMESCEIDQPLSPDKVKMFFKSTNEQFDEYLSSLKRITSSNPKSADCKKTYAYGSRIPLEKCCFQDDAVFGADNFDSILASMVISNLERHFSHSFVTNTRDRYQLKAEDIFPAIDKLKLHKDSHIIVNMNLNLSYYKSVLNVKGLTENDNNGIKTYGYKGIEIIELDSYDRIAGYSLFILEKKNLPYINFIKPSVEEQTKFELKERIVDENILASVINLNDNKNLRLELVASGIEKYKDKDLLRYVLVYISLILEIQWDKDIKVVQLQQYLHRDSPQLLSNMSDLRSFD